MKFVPLGSTGLKVSNLCLGTAGLGAHPTRKWIMGSDVARPFVRRALDLGINFFDTADSYNDGTAEALLGAILHDLVPRHEVVIASKVWYPTGSGPNDRGLSRKHVRTSIETSLRRFRTDHLDLYQLHRWDPETPVEETLAELDRAVRDGKLLYIGASSMFAWQMAKALAASDRLRLARFVSMTNHYNLVYREEEREMIPLCLDQGIAILPWSPLARGFLSGNRRRGDPGTPRNQSDPTAQERYFRDEDFAVAEATREIARERGVSPSQVAIAWLLHKPGVTSPVIGPSSLEQLEDLAPASELALSAEEIARLESPYHVHPVIGHA